MSNNIYGTDFDVHEPSWKAGYETAMRNAREVLAKDVNKNTPLLDIASRDVNSVQQQGGEEVELATKIYAASADLEWPDFVAYVNKVFDAEHGRLLVSTLEETELWVKQNKHDMGELGEFIRTQYVFNKLDELRDRLKSTSA